jgi:hypothetical protein
MEQDLTDESESTFNIPFTHCRSIRKGDDSEAFLMATCAPVGAVSSLMFLALWANGTVRSSGDLLRSEVTSITALKPDVEAVTGMYEIDEDAGADEASSISAWRRALVNMVSVQI